MLGPVEYKLSGFHDNFPWINVLVGTSPDNAVSVYEYDVCGKGKTAWDLLGGCTDEKVPDNHPAASWQPVPGTGGH